MLPSTASRNQAMDLAKLIASFFVLHIHVCFPGKFGSFIQTLATFAVPLFFAITGYFSYQINSKGIHKRLTSISRLYCTAIVLHILWGCIAVEMNGGSTVAHLIRLIPDPDEFLFWLVIQKDPFSGHLWYLAALLAVYLIFLLYIKKFGTNYQLLYVLSLFLFLGYFVIYMLPLPLDAEVVQRICRNAWLTGLPMFSFGLYLREKQHNIIHSPHLTEKASLLILLIGIVLVAVQWGSDSKCRRPFGMLLILAGILLLSILHPQVSTDSKKKSTLLSKCGSWSTWIYILHLLLQSVYMQLLYPLISPVLSFQAEQWVRPILIAIVSLVCAIGIEAAKSSIRLHKC